MAANVCHALPSFAAILSTAELTANPNLTRLHAYEIRGRSTVAIAPPSNKILLTACNIVNDLIDLIFKIPSYQLWWRWRTYCAVRCNFFLKGTLIPTSKSGSIERCLSACSFCLTRPFWKLCLAVRVASSDCSQYNSAAVTRCFTPAWSLLAWLIVVCQLFENCKATGTFDYWPQIQLHLGDHPKHLPWNLHQDQRLDALKKRVWPGPWL